MAALWLRNPTAIVRASKRTDQAAISLIDLIEIGVWNSFDYRRAAVGLGQGDRLVLSKRSFGWRLQLALIRGW